LFLTNESNSAPKVFMVAESCALEIVTIIL
jgi:hypothetical protein